MLLWLIIAVFATTGYGQLSIQEVRFEVGQKTRTEFLQNYLTLQAGSILDTAILIDDLQRLRNLDIFYDLNQVVENGPGGSIISYSAKEKKTKLPILNFGGIRENFWFQVGAVDGHFRGRGEVFGAYYTYYDRSSFNVFYKKPFIKSSRYGIEAIFQKLSTREPVSFNQRTAIYDYDNTTLEILGIYWINLNHRLKFGLAFLDEIYDKFDEPIFNEELPEFVNHKKWILKSKYEAGRLDYFANRINGIDNQAFFEVVVGSETGVFWKLLNELRAFKRLGVRHNLAGRFRFGLSPNTNSPFVPFVLDSYINIRGSGNRVARGTGEIVVNLEYRYNLQESSWGIVQGVLFWDVGGWRPINQGFDAVFQSENITSFIGFGGRVYFKKIYNLNLRADFGINTSQPEQNGIVIGLGQYF